MCITENKNCCFAMCITDCCFVYIRSLWCHCVQRHRWSIQSECICSTYFRKAGVSSRSAFCSTYFRKECRFILGNGVAFDI